MSAVVFGLSWWLGLYLLARDPRKPVLVLAAIGLLSFAVVVALDAVRVAGGPYAELLSRIEVYIVVIPGIAWFAVLLELSRSGDTWRSRVGEMGAIAVVAALALTGATLAGGVNGPAAPWSLGDVRGHLRVHPGCDGRGDTTPEPAAAGASALRSSRRCSSRWATRSW